MGVWDGLMYPMSDCTEERRKYNLSTLDRDACTDQQTHENDAKPAPSEPVRPPSVEHSHEECADEGRDGEELRLNGGVFERCDDGPA
jgi:hypothetical protein